MLKKLNLERCYIYRDNVNENFKHKYNAIIPEYCDHALQNE